MDDKKTTIAQVREKIVSFMRERDWEQFHNPQTVSMALSIEASELLEKFAWMTGDASRSVVDKNRDEIEQELADIIILALEFSNICSIDIAQAVERKMEINAKKYPVEKAKGSNLKYDKL